MGLVPSFYHLPQSWVLPDPPQIWESISTTPIYGMLTRKAPYIGVQMSFSAIKLAETKVS